MKHLLCSAFLTASFLLPAGELLNRNAGMELGIPGKGAPGLFWKKWAGNAREFIIVLICVHSFLKSVS